MSTTVNLSLLARGRGSIKKNGHERVDVIFEPEDYYSWAEDSNKLYTLPPLQPKQAFITPRTGRELHEVALPKTFITRKGALLLFSEDLALKGEGEDGENGQGRTHDGLGLKTVEDLTKSILSYGSQSESVNLRFVKERGSWIGTRRIRPGFSARRYLSRLTRSFDDTFLEKLQTKGYISDKTLFQQSDILPHIKRRINDDLSYMPTPYRIMRQMLISPGLLSGYTFYRMESSSGLTEISEEEQSSPAAARPLTGTVIIVGVEQPGPDDMVKPVNYEDLSQQEKQNVLTDLLVKSTINHALQKQKELIEGSLKGDEDEKESGRGSSVDKKSVIQDFNMANAIKSYLDGQPEILSQHGDYSAAQSARDGGSDKQSQGSVNERLPSLQEPSQQNVNVSRINSRERIFNKTPLLPPIRPDDSGYPGAAEMPATPQLSNQSQAGSAPKAQSREPTLGLAQQRMTESPEEEEEETWGADVNEMELLKNAVSASPEGQKLLQKRGSGRSTGSRGPVLAAGSFLESSTENMKVPPGTVASSTGQAASWKGSQKSLISQGGKEERTTPGGTVIVVPGGGVVSAEVSFSKQDEIIDAVTSANIEQRSHRDTAEPPDSETENQQAGQDETASGKSSLSGRAVPETGTESVKEGKESDEEKEEIEGEKEEKAVKPEEVELSVSEDNGTGPQTVTNGDQSQPHSEVEGGSVPRLSLGSPAATPEIQNDSQAEQMGLDKSSEKLTPLADGATSDLGFDEGSVHSGNMTVQSARGYVEGAGNQSQLAQAPDGRLSQVSKMSDSIVFDGKTPADVTLETQTSASDYVSGDLVPPELSGRQGNFSLPSIGPGSSAALVSHQLPGDLTPRSADAYGTASQATTEPASEGTISSRPVSEQEVVSALTEHAHKIASAVLSHPGSGVDLIQDAQAAAELWLENTPVSQLSRSQSLQDVSKDERATQEMMTVRRGGARSANAHVAEYKELLKETLTTALSKATGSSQESIAKDLEVSEELVEALANQELDPEDIEIVQDEKGKSIIRTKTPSSHRTGSARSVTSGGLEDKQSVKGDAASIKDTASTVGGRKSTMSKSGLSKRGSIAESMRSISARSKATADSGKLPGTTAAPPGGEATAGSGGGDPLSMDVINYGQVDRPEAEKSEIIVRPEVTTVREAGPRRESKSSTKSEEEISDTKSTKSKQSAKSKSSEAKSKNSLEDRDEFVVGKVEQKGELEKLYGQLESPVKSPESKPKKPPVPKATKSPKKKTKKKKTKKEGSPEAKSPAKTPKSPTPPPPEPDKSPEKEPTPQPPSERSPTPNDMVSEPQDESHSPTPSFKTESEASEESMEFIIIRDEFPSPEPEPEVEVKSVLSVQSSIPQSATTYSDTDSDDSSALKMITDKDARAAKRAAQAAKRREQVERKRREREEQLRKEKEEAERQERLKLELEEERRKKEEERRLKRLREEEERRREEEEEQNKLRRAMQDAERERRQKEEYQRKLEEMKKRQAEEDRRRAELAAIKAAEDEERRRQEEEMMSKMAEQERLEYERKKQEEEEERKRQEELERIRLEEEAKKAMEEAKRLAEEMARRQAEIEARLQFNRSLQLESHGLEHTQDVTRAFVFSYYELLQWLGLEVPEFERLKESLK